MGIILFPLAVLGMFGLLIGFTYVTLLIVLYCFIFIFSLFVFHPLNSVFNHFMWIGEKYERLACNWYKYKNRRDMELCHEIEFYETGGNEKDNVSFNKKQAYGIQDTAKDIEECLDHLGQEHKMKIMGPSVEYFFSKKTFIREHLKRILLFFIPEIMFMFESSTLMAQISPIISPKVSEVPRVNYRFYRGVLIQVPDKKLYIYVSFLLKVVLSWENVKYLRYPGKFIKPASQVAVRASWADFIQSPNYWAHIRMRLFNRCIQISGITHENREFALELESKITEKLKQNPDIRFLTPESTHEDIKIN